MAVYGEAIPSASEAIEMLSQRYFMPGVMPVSIAINAVVESEPRTRKSSSGLIKEYMGASILRKASPRATTSASPAAAAAQVCLSRTKRWVPRPPTER